MREIFGSAAGTVISNTLFAACVIGLRAALGDAIKAEAFWGGIVAGLLVAFPFSLLHRIAILEADDLIVGAARYMTPLLALGWLAAFSLAGPADFRLLLLGAALVMAARALGRYRRGVSAAGREGWCIMR